MFDLIESMMEFIYKHRIFRKFFYYTFWSILGMLCFVWFLIYKNTGVVNFHLKILFDLNTYKYLMNIYDREIAIFLALEQVTLIGIIFYQNHKLKSPLDKSEIEKIDIKELSKIWLNEEEIVLQDTLMQELKKPIFAPDDTKMSMLNVANFNNEKTLVFCNEILKNHLNYLNLKQVESIIKLIQLLEKNKDCPSVVSHCKEDSNRFYGEDRKNTKRNDNAPKIGAEIVTLDGKTRYDIYAEISLYEHSLGVAKKIISLLNEDKNLRAYKKSFMGKAIIAALAHDIGKINNYNLKKEVIISNFTQNNTKDFAYSALQKSVPHHQLSYMILYDGFKDCPELNEIANAVKKHHNGMIEKDEILLKLLVDADKKTREDELDDYLKKNPSFAPSITPTNLQSKNQNENSQQNASKSEEIRNLNDLKATYNKVYFAEKKKHCYLFILKAKVSLEDLQETFSHILFKTLEKEIYKENEKYFILIEQKDKTNAFNFFYDFGGILKQKNEYLKIGFAMFKDCVDIEEAICGAEIALQSIMKLEKIIYKDYKDLKNDKKSNILLKDYEDEIGKQKNENETKDDFLETLEMFESIDKKVDTLEVVGSLEESFDIQMIEQTLFEILKSKINTSKQKGFVNSVQIITHKNLVLVSKECLMEALSIALKDCVKNIERKTNYLIRYYRYHSDENKRLIWFVGVDKGFYHSRYILVENKQNYDFYCIPFDSKKAFGLSPSDLENMKNNSDLKATKVLQFNKNI
ncbi:HD domain-containing protein [Campylobacter helveticus]|uniref:HD domain-containing protein n=1 Tax=Campylobacter helveticus TaxID=28898 RepID=UPI001116AD31|nr:HD domain-containing protein [Campylobacter helveticus]TNH33891.1 HD domain-containing protein [Campylobacter helveticus]TNH36342.1 HD domain-containing protein [Campylobacter helveticus]